MATTPDMIIQYAHYLADNYEHKTGVRPTVRVTAVESLNHRPAQDLIDPNVDLAAQPESFLPKPWIVPLRPLGAAAPLMAPAQSSTTQDSVAK